MRSEISRIARWTGSLRICTYWTSPKPIPPTQMMSPNRSRLCPDIPRKFTEPRSGIVSSASLAPAVVANRDAASANSPATILGEAANARRMGLPGPKVGSTMLG